MIVESQAKLGTASRRLSFVSLGAMAKSKRRAPVELSCEQIADAVAERLEKYERLGFLERFAMFMGVAQLLELGLKRLLHTRFGVDLESIERWTLGRTARALKERGLRPDFIVGLDSVVEYRNYIAHEMLANEAIVRSLLDGKATRFEVRGLDKAIYELEQLIFLFEWTNEHDPW